MLFLSTRLITPGSPGMEFFMHCLLLLLSLSLSLSLSLLLLLLFVCLITYLFIYIFLVSLISWAELLKAWLALTIG